MNTYVHATPDQSIVVETFGQERGAAGFVSVSIGEVPNSAQIFLSVDQAVKLAAQLVEKLPVPKIAEPATPPEPKVGDRVKVTNVNGYTVGNIYPYEGTITKLPGEGDLFYTVNTLRFGLNRLYRRNEFEVLESTSS